MGAWAEDSFGNDRACDWLGGYLDAPGLRALTDTIEEVHSTRRYLHGNEACDCLAACEVIARLAGRWGERSAYTEDLDTWAERNSENEAFYVPPELRERAVAAIDRIVGPNSELQEQWDEGGRCESWHQSVANLRERVQG